MMSGARHSLADEVFTAFLDRSVMAEHFPMLLSEGIPDVGLTIHSHFLSVLAGVGQSMHYAAVAECPIWWAREDGVGDVRADSVWFDKTPLRPRLAFEFERFERGDESKLRGKLENLSIASNNTEDLRLCILVYWVRSGSAPRSMAAIVASYRDGFRRNGKPVAPARTPLMLVKCVMREVAGTDRLVFGEFLRDERNERLALGSA
jgi:hypothetical protein